MTRIGTAAVLATLLLAAGAWAQAPKITKLFGQSPILVGQTTPLTFTITNTDTFTVGGVGFSDTLRSGLVVATPNGLSGSCGGGTITVI